jgi:hypothetical protein
MDKLIVFLGTTFVVLLLVLVITPLFSLYYAWAFSYLWLWFIVPLGFPAISVVQAMGIFIVKGLLFYKYVNIPKEKAGEAVTGFVLAPIVSLTVGQIILWFIGA